MSYFQYSIGTPKGQLLVRWLKSGISHLRHEAQIPQNLVSDQTLHRACQAIPDELLVRPAQDLGLADIPSLYETAHRVPDLNMALSTIEGQNALQQWVTQYQPILILQALGKVLPKLTAYISEGAIKNPRRVVTILFTLALVPFSSSSDDLFSKLGTILNCHEPHSMIEKLSVIAMRGESQIIDNLEDVIVSNSRWGGWASWFMEEIQSLAPQCWGRLVVSRESPDPSKWRSIWDALLNWKEEANGK
jgi:hypothetical protein